MVGADEVLITQVGDETGADALRGLGRGAPLLGIGVTTFDVFRLAERVAEAPLDPGAWPQLLADIAATSGGWGGELITGADGRFRMYITGNIPPDLLREFAGKGGADPLVNPRAAAVFAATPMKLLCDPDYISDATRDRHPLYADFLNKVDANYASLAVLRSTDEPAPCSPSHAAPGKACQAPSNWR